MKRNKIHVAAVAALLLALSLASCNRGPVGIKPDDIPTPGVDPQITALPNTGDTLVKGAQSVIDSLKTFKLSIDANVGLSIDPAIAGNLKIAADGVIAGLNLQIQELRKLLQDDVSRPLEQMGYNVQEVARQINSAVVRANLLLEQQHQSFFLSAQVLLSGLQTIALDVKNPLNPFKQEDPRLYYFQFTGVPPSVVPKQGGRFTIIGYHLWSDTDPDVELLDEQRKPLKKLTAEKALDNNTISVVLDRDVVASQVGKVLQIHVRAHKGKKFLFIPLGGETFDLYLNCCVPQAYSTKFQITAYIQYDTKRTDQHELPAGGPPSDTGHQFFRWDNADCDADKGKTVGDTRHWNIPAGFRIVSYRVLNHEEHVGGSNINLSIVSSDTIAASGHITAPNCINLFVGKKLQEVAVWATDIVPTIQGEVIETHPAQAAVVSDDMTIPQTLVNLQIPKAAPSDYTTFWFTVSPIINGTQGAVIYSAPKTTVGASGGSSPLDLVGGGLGVEGLLNPAPVNGNANLRVTIHCALK